MVEAVVAGVIIAAALVVGTLGLFLPWFVNHPEKVQRFLSDQLRRPVTFEHLDGQWTASGPVFTLTGLKLGGDTPLTVGSAELAIDFYAFAKPDVSFSDFRVVGLEVDVAREVDGTWRVVQLGRQPTGGDGDSALDGLGSVSLKRARLTFIDRKSGHTLAVSRVDAKLVNDPDGRRLGAHLWVAPDSPPLRVACALDEAASGRCYAAGEALEPARWLAAYPVAGVAPVSGALSAAVWIDVTQARPMSVQAELAATDLVLRGTRVVAFADGDEVEPRWSIPAWSLAAAWRRQADGWRVDAQERRGESATPTRIAARATVDARGAGTLTLEAPRVVAGDWLPIAALSDATPAAVRSLLYENGPSGTLRDVRLVLRPAGYDVDARAEKLALRTSYKRPGFDSISGVLRGDEHGLVFTLAPEQDFTLDFRHMFRQPIAVKLHRGTLAAHRSEAGWRLEVSDLDLDGDGFGAVIAASLLFDPVGKRPTLEAYAEVKPGGRVPVAKRFWPVNVMPPKAVEWLDRALVSGTIVGAHASVRGDLDDWPFKREPSGRFEARAVIADATLDYKDEWPVAEIGAAEAVFVNEGMVVSLASGETAGLAVSEATAAIEHMKDPLLTLAAKGEGSGADMLRFLRESPVATKYGPQLVGVTIGGTGQIDVDLVLPLDKKLGLEPSLTGSVHLVDADLADAKYDLAFERANGRVRFSDDGFSADSLAASAAGEPIELSISAGEFTSTPAHAAEASLRGDVPAQALFGEYPELAPYLARLSGRSSWAVELAVPDDGAPQQLRVRSDLVGTEVALPAPLAKAPELARALDVRLELPPTEHTVVARYGELLEAKLALPSPTRAFAADLAFAGATLGDALPAGLRVRGHAPSIDLAGWGGLGGEGTASTADVEITTDALRVSGRTFDDVALTYRPSGRGTRATIRGPAIAGAIAWAVSPEGRPSLTAEFERLHLPEAAPDSAPMTIDPATLPALHFWAKDLRFGAASLGEARIEAFPTERGFRFDELETDAPNLEVRARGDWTLVDAVERSQFDITFTAQSLGGMLDALGFEGIIEGGQTMARLNGGWLGSPAAFSLGKIAGSLEASVGKGRMLDVEPGAGRLFGLISIQSIPRRLTLDFSDFFKSGLAFDSIAGTFRLDRGNAYTEDLVVKGPSADIRITGRTGIAARDYEQQMEVVPRVGGVLPVVGALAAGPAGAAAGLFANVLPFGRALRTTYRVGGSWEKPDITVIARERHRRGAAREAAEPED